MYVIFLQCTHCVKTTLTVSCTLLCESGDRVMVDQSSFSADLRAVMLRHHCSEFVCYGENKLMIDAGKYRLFSPEGRTKFSPSANLRYVTLRKQMTFLSSTPTAGLAVSSEKLLQPCSSRLVDCVIHSVIIHKQGQQHVASGNESGTINNQIIILFCILYFKLTLTKLTLLKLS